MNRYKKIRSSVSHYIMRWLLALLLCMAMPFSAFSQELPSEIVSSCNTANRTEWVRTATALDTSGNSGHTVSSVPTILLKYKGNKELNDSFRGHDFPYTNTGMTGSNFNVIPEYVNKVDLEFSDGDVIIVYVGVPSRNMEFKEKLTNLLGEPEITPKEEHEKFASIPSHYIVPVSKIDKIIGIKKYRDKRMIEEFDSRIYINEGEEIVLDLKNFDMDIYKIFEEHGMLSMYDDEEEPKHNIYEK